MNTEARAEPYSNATKLGEAFQHSFIHETYSLELFWLIIVCYASINVDSSRT